MKASIRNPLFFVLGLAFTLFTINSCKHKVPQDQSVVDGGYPEDVNRIIQLHCTIGPTGGGCHNSYGATNAAGLRLDTWDNLFYGSNHGATVVPYDTINSPFLNSISPDSNLSPQTLPTMPYTGTNYSTTPLSTAEFLTIRNWIARGAPDKNGNIPFGDNPDTRQKIYLTEQGSDYLSAIDVSRKVIMRNIPIGMVSNVIEAPHCVRVSKDGKYAYVSFLSGDYIQKIDATTDKVVASTRLSNGGAQWNVLMVSNDGTKLMIADFIRGVLQFVRTSDMVNYDSIITGVSNVHGLASTPNFDTLFATVQYGNTILKYFPNRNYKKVTLDHNPSTYDHFIRDPHEIQMVPDYSRYYVTCEYSNEVRVMDTHTDAILDSIPMPQKPQDMAISKNKPYIFVSCMEAQSTVAGTLGAIVVINYETDQIVKTIYGNFWQPHGISVDDNTGTFYVTSTNQTGISVGHNHTSGGKHGWYNVYSIETLEPVSPHQFETLVLPYTSDSRFK